MSALTAALYVLCLLFLTAFPIFVFLQNPRSGLHRTFALLAFALLGWVASLFAFDFPMAPRHAPLRRSPQLRQHRLRRHPRAPLRRSHRRAVSQCFQG